MINKTKAKLLNEMDKLTDENAELKKNKIVRKLVEEA